MIPNRIQRVNHELRRLLSQFIRELKDPRISDLVSITDVVTARDLRTARVYVSLFDTPERRAEVARCLNDASRHLRQRVREASRLRAIPELTFFADDSIERGVRVCQIIDESIREDEKT